MNRKDKKAVLHYSKKKKKWLGVLKTLTISSVWRTLLRCTVVPDDGNTASLGGEPRIAGGLLGFTSFRLASDTAEHTFRYAWAGRGTPSSKKSGTVGKKNTWSNFLNPQHVLLVCIWALLSACKLLTVKQIKGPWHCEIHRTICNGPDGHTPALCMYGNGFKVFPYTINEESGGKQGRNNQESFVLTQTDNIFHAVIHIIVQ